MKKPVIVVLDIETAPIEAFVWALWKQNVGLNQIKTEWTILSFAAKTLGKRRVRYMDTGARGAHEVRNDRAVLQALWDELNKADIIVAQNGVKFDIRKINARFIEAGFKPYSPVKIVDTMLAARKVAAFTSNRLEWLASNLTSAKKLKHEKFPGFELWLECLKDNPTAWAEMKKYNVADIKATEELYLTLRPWIEGHPNVAVYNSAGEVIACPKCGGQHVKEHGSWFTQVNEYVRYICGSCGGFSRSRYTTNSLARRKSLLSN